MTLLSVVTVTKNNLKGLVVTADSIPADFNTIEWIVIDGNSDDGTIDYLERSSHEKLSYISEPDQGIFDAMNKGLRLATGELIIFLNAGDSFVSHETPRSIIDHFDANSWEWAVGGAITVNSSGEQLWRWPAISPRSLKLKLAINSYCHQSTVYRRNHLLSLNGFVVDSYHSDWVTSLQFLKISRPFIVDEDWIFFLEGGVSSTRGLDYWYSESVRLRQITGTTIFGSRWIDKYMQKIVKSLLKSTRGQLLRPDLFQ